MLPSLKRILLFLPALLLTAQVLAQVTLKTKEYDELRDKANKYEELKKELDDLQKVLETANKKLTNTEGKLSRLEEENRELTNTLKNEEGEVKGYKSRMRGLRDSLDQALKRMDNLEAYQSSSLRFEREALALQDTILRLKDRLAAEQVINQTTGQELNELSAVQTRNQALSLQVVELEKAMEELLRKSVDDSLELQDLREVESRVMANQQELNSLMARNQALIDDKIDLEEQLESSRRAVAALTQKINVEYKPIRDERIRELKSRINTMVAGNLIPLSDPDFQQVDEELRGWTSSPEGRRDLSNEYEQFMAFKAGLTTLEEAYKALDSDFEFDQIEESKQKVDALAAKARNPKVAQRAKTLSSKLRTYCVVYQNAHYDFESIAESKTIAGKKSYLQDVRADYRGYPYIERMIKELEGSGFKAQNPFNDFQEGCRTLNH